jgi:hypothetical protein
LPLASLYISSLKDVGLEQEGFIESNLINVNNFDNIIVLEL